jgi:hypothetical protein
MNLALSFFFFRRRLKMLDSFCLSAEASEFLGRFLQGFFISENFPDRKREKQW